MAEHASTAKASAAARPQGPVALADLAPGSVAEIHAWPATVPQVRAALSAVVPFPEDVGASAERGGILVAALAPGRWIAFGDDPTLAAVIAASVDPDTGAVVDLSHARAGVRLSGGAAADVLARGLAVDLHPAAFPPGRAAQAAIDHFAVLVLRRSETVFDLHVGTSYGEDFVHWIETAAIAVGIERRPPAGVVP